MLQNYLMLILRNFSRRKLRGWLTILGILIGITAVVALISVTQGMQGAIQGQFEKLGSNKIMVTAGSGGGLMGLAGGAFASKQITEDDLDVIRQSKGVDIATALLAKMGGIKFGDQIKYTYVIGMPTSSDASVFKDMQDFTPEKGRQLKEGDKYAVNVGYLIGQEKGLFDKPVRVGNKVEIEGKEFKVVGIIKKLGNQQDDIQIYIPLETAREVYNEKTEISFIYVQTKEGYNVSQVAENIKKDLRKFRDEKKDEETFQVQTFEQILGQVNTIMGVISLVLIVISLISLVVGGVGIMNTMYTSVLERTKEIGIMKAVGAKNNQIMLLFMIESGFYGLVGGIIGIILGLSMAKGAELAASAAGYPMLKASFSLTLIFGALFFSFLIGSISGLAPARAAAKLRPVQALRYE